MRTSRTECRPGLGGQDGFTILEVMIAAFVLLVGVMAMMTTFVSSGRLELVSERQSSMAHIAQKEIERIEGTSYASVGLSSAPAPSSDKLNPDYYVSTSGSSPTFEWDRSAGSAEPLDVDTANGAIAPVQSWSEGSLSGSIYDFVTWTSDPDCSPGCSSSSRALKRITVAVTMAGENPSPVYVSSLLADPGASPVGGVVNGTAGNPISDATTQCVNAAGTPVTCESPIDSGNPNTYFLHDCAATNASCPAPGASSTTHQTVGVASGLICSATALTGLTAALTSGCPVPDEMDPSPPAGSTTSTLYQYTTDLGTTGYPGGGLLRPSAPGSGGTSTGTGGGTGQASDCTSGGGWSSSLLASDTHMWLSAPLSSSLTLTGDGGLALYSQTLGGAAAVVSFCLEIYDVPPSDGTSGSIADLNGWPPVPLGGAGYAAATNSGTGANWPTSVAQVAYTFNFRGSSGPVTIAAGHRIGVRVWAVVNANVPVDLVYDNPLYPSEIQLNSQ